MVLKQHATDPHFASHDAIFELRHGRERAGNTSVAMEFSRLLEKQSSMDEVYMAMSLGLLAADYRSAPPKEKINTYKDSAEQDDDCDVEEEEIHPDYLLVSRHLKEDDKSYGVVGQREKSEAHKKRKRKDIIRVQDDDCDVEEEEEIHPDYALVLRHLKEDNKSYGVVGQREKSEALKKWKRKDIIREQDDDAFVSRHLKDGDKSRVVKFEKTCLLLAMKYKSEMGYNVADGKEQHFYPKHSRRNHCVSENLCERVCPAQTGERNKVQSQRKLKKVAGYANVVKGDHESFERAKVRFHKEHFYHRPSPGNDRLVKNQSWYRGGAQISEKNKVQNRVKYGGEARSGDKNKIHCVRKKTRVVTQTNLVRKHKQPDRTNVVQIDKSYLYQKSGPRSKKVKECPLEHANKAQPGETEKVRGQRYLQQLDRGKKAVGEDGAAKRKAVVLLDNDHFHHKCIQEKIRPIKYEREYVAQAQPVKKYKEQIGGKLKGMIKEEVKKENEKIYHHAGQVQLGKEHVVRGQTELMKVVRGDCGLSSKKTVFGNCAVKKEPDDCVQTDLHSQIRHVKCARIVPAEVEILDSDMVVKKRILNPFVSNQIQGMMLDEESQHLGLPSASDVFRKEVLKVLRKPYDKQEHQNYREAIRIGSYLDYYPDLRKKLTKFRYQREKRLILIRGFLFWLQNLTREGEGVFRPWEDKECLAVELSSR